MRAREARRDVLRPDGGDTPPVPPRGPGARYANHPDENYRRLAVRDPAATPELIERLGHDHVVWTRQAASRDPRLPFHRLREAYTSPNWYPAWVPTRRSPEDEMAAVLDQAAVPA